VPESMTSSSRRTTFDPLHYVRWVLGQPPRWVRLGVGPLDPQEWPDARNHMLAAADAMNASWPEPDPNWALDRAAADAEVEPDEQPKED